MRSQSVPRPDADGVPSWELNRSWRPLSWMERRNVAVQGDDDQTGLFQRREIHHPEVPTSRFRMCALLPHTSTGALHPEESRCQGRDHAYHQRTWLEQRTPGSHGWRTWSPSANQICVICARTGSRSAITTRRAPTGSPAANARLQVRRGVGGMAGLVVGSASGGSTSHGAVGRALWAGIDQHQGQSARPPAIWSKAGMKSNCRGSVIAVSECAVCVDKFHSIQPDDGERTHA